METHKDTFTYPRSLPAWGAWIEIPSLKNWQVPLWSRSPHGERGLKSHGLDVPHVVVRRSPHGERGLKSCTKERYYAIRGRSPHGERGLKLISANMAQLAAGRSPHGERGLK